MTDVRPIDVNAAIIDLREQIVAFFGEAKKEVKPEDYYITKLSAYHEDLERLQIDNFIAYLNSRPTINPDDLRPHGWWEEIRNDYGELEGWLHVDCGRESKSKDKYCGTCGAKMDGKENKDA